MAIGVDSSKWKPRKLTGTPASKAANVVSICVLSVGLLCGAFYQYSGATSKYRKALEKFYSDPEEEVERKLIIASGLPNRSGDTIRKLIDEDARPDLPHK